MRGQQVPDRPGQVGTVTVPVIDGPFEGQNVGPQVIIPESTLQRVTGAQQPPTDFLDQGPNVGQTQPTINPPRQVGSVDQLAGRFRQIQGFDRRSGFPGMNNNRRRFQPRGMPQIQQERSFRDNRRNQGVFRNQFPGLAQQRQQQQRQQQQRRQGNPQFLQNQFQRRPTQPTATPRINPFLANQIRGRQGVAPFTNFQPNFNVPGMENVPLQDGDQLLILPDLLASRLISRRRVERRQEIMSAPPAGVPRSLVSVFGAMPGLMSEQRILSEASGVSPRIRIVPDDGTSKFKMHSNTLNNSFIYYNAFHTR